MTHTALINPLTRLAAIVILLGVIAGGGEQLHGRAAAPRVELTQVSLTKDTSSSSDARSSCSYRDRRDILLGYRSGRPVGGTKRHRSGQRQTQAGRLTPDMTMKIFEHDVRCKYDRQDALLGNNDGWQGSKLEYYRSKQQQSLPDERTKTTMPRRLEMKQSEPRVPEWIIHAQTPRVDTALVEQEWFLDTRSVKYMLGRTGKRLHRHWILQRSTWRAEVEQLSGAHLAHRGRPPDM